MKRYSPLSSVTCVMRALAAGQRHGDAGQHGALLVHDPADYRAGLRLCRRAHGNQQRERRQKNGHARLHCLVPPYGTFGEVMRSCDVE